MLKEFTKGLIKENPVLVIMLGLCPTLAISTTVYNAIGMGFAVIFVLTMSNIIISLIRKTVPSEIRLPIFIVVIASFVTITDLVMKAYTPDLSKQLGIFIPLIVVNCIILGRAEAFASKNNVVASTLDGLGMGVGFTFIVALIALVREVLGSGRITFGIPMVIDKFEINILGAGYNPALIMILPPGGFLTIAVFLWFKQWQTKKS